MTSFTGAMTPTRTSTDQQTRSCPTCDHPLSEPTADSALFRLFRLNPRAARCRVIDPETQVSGWGDPCDCIDPFHGS